jgi:hypothetical protein
MKINTNQFLYLKNILYKVIQINMHSYEYLFAFCFYGGCYGLCQS